ncbi:MAG: hypothetical protein ABIU38_03975 [Vicinamibacteraceae bacterium]
MMVRYLGSRHRLATLAALVLATLVTAVRLAAAQAPPVDQAPPAVPAAPAAPATAPAAAPVVIPPGGPNIRLQLRVFDGVNEVTRETRVRLFPAGKRGTPIRLTLGTDRAYEADVPVGLYDVQAIRSRSAPESIAGVRWVEHMLVQKYPDEYGRHLQVVHLREGFGALQIRPEGTTPVPVGWSAVATAPGVPATEVGRARALGPDLLLVLPAGTYDVKVVLPSEEPVWITGIDIPDARTRLKTWPLRP